MTNKVRCSGKAIIIEDNRLLTIVKKDEDGLYYIFPGGGQELGETIEQCVKRECLEELGVLADFWTSKPIFITQAMTVGLTAGHTDVSLWYVIKGTEKHDYQYDKEEFSGIKWFGLDEIPYERSDPHMERFICKLKGCL